MRIGGVIVRGVASRVTIDAFVRRRDGLKEKVSLPVTTVYDTALPKVARRVSLWPH